MKPMTREYLWHGKTGRIVKYYGTRTRSSGGQQYALISGVPRKEGNDLVKGLAFLLYHPVRTSLFVSFKSASIVESLHLKYQRNKESHFCLKSWGESVHLFMTSFGFENDMPRLRMDSRDEVVIRQGVPLSVLIGGQLDLLTSLGNALEVSGNLFEVLS